MLLVQIPTKPHCPFCSKLLDGVLSLDGSMPPPGGATVCAGCGNILRFTHDMQLEDMPTDAFFALPELERVLLSAASLAALTRGKPRKGREH